MGCGVACVAFVTRRSYTRALAFFEEVPGDPCKVGYSRRSLIAALSNAGKTYVYRGYGSVPEQQRSAKELPAGSIAFIRDHQYRRGHYLVRVGNRWMDPDGALFLPTLPAQLRSAICPAP